MGKSKHFGKHKRKSQLRKLVLGASVAKFPDSTPSPVELKRSEPLAEAEAPAVKRVRFAEKLDNDSSLDSSMRERIEHNLKYNDDTIFDGISIF